MKWVNKPSKEVLATSARMHQKICAIIICATKPCQPVACTKMNKTNHGMGIKLMQRIVDKYNGFLSLENDDNYFVVIAVLIEKIM